ncbi:MAG: DUF6783 domain-containing protein [Ruminococcus sp.]
MREKYTAKQGARIEGMIFQTRSGRGIKMLQNHFCNDFAAFSMTGKNFCGMPPGCSSEFF